MQPLTTLTILQLGQDYVFQVEPPWARGAAALDMMVQPVTAQNRRQIQAEIEVVAHSLLLLNGLDHSNIKSRSPSARDALRQLGRLMFDLFLPTQVQSFLKDLTPQTPLLISTNDTLMPWELVHDGTEFLALKCPLGRRSLSSNQVRRNPSDPHAGKSFLLIADPAGDLPEADAEIAALMDLLDGLPEWSNYEVLARRGATKSEVLSHLSAGSWDVIHFSGHIALDESGTQASSLLLADGEVLTAEEIRRTVRGTPLIFLNGCSSVKEDMDVPKESQGAASLEEFVPYAGLPVRGLASAFLLGGSAGFIGTLWPVYDTAARDFAVRFYRSALGGEAVGQALRQARETTTRENPANPIWSSFVFYGDPTLRIAEIAGRERRMVTCLCARLGGLTEIFLQLGLEEAASVQDAGFKFLVQELSASGGQVDAQSHNTIMVTFGAPWAYGDDAKRAVQAALSAKRAWEEFSGTVARRTGANLPLSLALTTGEVVAGQITIGAQTAYLVRGQSIDLANRLVQQVPAGQAWVDELTYRLSRPNFDFAAEEQPVLELNQTIYRLLGDRPQQIGALAHKGRFIGREAALEVLRNGWQTAQNGKGGALITVVGDAGTGKSRLIEAWRSEVADAPSRWVLGTCQPEAQNKPYGLLSSLLRQLFGLESADDKAVARAKMRRVLDQVAQSQQVSGTLHTTLALALLGETLEAGFSDLPTSDLDAVARRSQLARIILGLMTYQAIEKPWIIILEDTHWIDEDSLAVLDRLVEGITGLPALLVIVHRSSWKHDWTTRRNHQQIVLDRLSYEDSQALLADLLESKDLPTDLGETILSTADGNPFFLEEIVRSLIDTQTVIQSNGAWQMTRRLEELTIPTTIQATLQARIDRLKSNEKLVLRTAAVIGLEFTDDVLTALAEAFPELLVNEGLDELCHQEFLQLQSPWPETRYAFQHALIQQVAYDGLLAKQRKQLHRQVGQVLETLYGGEQQAVHLDQLAYHFYEGEAWPQALAYQLRAGKKALAIFAHETAKKYLERTKELIESARLAPNLEQRLACYESLGDVYTVQGHFEEARECYQAVMNQPEIEGLAAADLDRKLAQTYERQGQYDPALEWLQKGLEAFSGRPDDVIAARLCLLHGIIDARQGRPDQALVWAERALRAIEGKRALAEEAQACNLMGVLCRSQGQLDLAAQYCQHSAELYETLNNPLKAAAAYNNLGVVAFDRDDWPGAEVAGRQALKLQETTDDAYGQATTHCNLADLYWRLGQLENAEAHAQAGLRLAQALDSAYLQALAHENLAIVFLRQKKSGRDPLEHLLTSCRLLEENDIQELRSEVQSLLAEAYLREKQLDEAARAAQQALAIAVQQKAQLDEGVARRMLGRVQNAQGDQQGAESELQASLEVLECAGRRYETGRTLKELAALYAQDKAQHTERHVALQRAIAIFKELGAGLDLKETQALM
jgi:tetratricopeptide (TPR) repeat protein/class 3 adenylate cyclase